MMLAPLTLIPLCALMNRARGSHFDNMLASTIESRLVSMAIIALVVFGFTGNYLLLPVTFAGLCLWCWSSWDKYWSEEIGQSATHSRLYGLMQMTIRMSLAIPALVSIAYFGGHDERSWFALGALSFSLPYYILGFILPSATVIKYSELAVGTLLGILIYLILFI